MVIPAILKRNPLPRLLDARLKTAGMTGFAETAGPRLRRLLPWRHRSFNRFYMPGPERELLALISAAPRKTPPDFARHVPG